MRLYIMRHGETDSNRAKRLQGRADNPLNENGIRLAREVGERLADIKFSLWISSPLKRAVKTGEAVLSQNRVSGTVPFERDERIVEISFGSWEGLGCGRDNFELDCDNFSDFYRDPELVSFPSDAESVSSVKKRTLDFLRSTVLREDFKTGEDGLEKNILITTHGFAMRALLNSLYENKGDFWQGRVPANCAVNIVEADNFGNTELSARDLILYDSRELKDYFRP
ncbi:MAG: histidine phosphatase family protein [Candidatus Avilachnospira sp.]|jgi:broad specificity phosphatase PhoE